MQFFDTHAHLDDERFPDLDGVLSRARQASVDHVIAIGTTAKSSQQVARIAEQKAGVFAAVGIQPNYVDDAVDSDWQTITRLCQLPQVVAIGETGIDHYWDRTDLDRQREYFRRHIALSLEHDLPLVIHMRDPQRQKNEAQSRSCGEDILRVLQEFADRPLRGVMHSYTGEADLATELMALGLHTSFAGMVTYKNAANLREVARSIPPDRILIETDAPYLSPEPQRKTRPCEPALVVHTAACLAEVRGQTLDQFAHQTTQNAARLFGISLN